MSYRSFQLRSAVDRSRARVESCQRALDALHADLNDPQARERHRRLVAALKRAQSDAAWLEHQLSAAEG